MHKYWLTFKLSLQDNLEYRWDNIIRALRYSLAILLVMGMWLGISRESTKSAILPDYIVTYYFFAAILYGLSNFHLDFIEREIRLGYMSKYLVKPISPFWHYCLSQGATAAFETVFKTLLFIPIIYSLGYSLQTSLPHIFLYLAYLPVIYVAMFSLYFGISTMAFWFQNVESVRMAAMFVARFSSGVFIPLSFLPSHILKWLNWTPFPHLAFTPIQLIKGELSLEEGLSSLLILSLWTLSFFIFQKAMWHYATHSYESTGI